MIGTTITTFPKLKEGILVKRYKRFLADVELEDGVVVTAHCANTGPMKGVLQPGGKVRLRHSQSPSRKLEWSWEQALVSSVKGECWVGVNTSLPNRIVRLAVEAGLLKNQLGEIIEIKNEVTYGIDRKSRIDLLLKPNPGNIDPRQIFLEIKNTTWKKGEKALFPDTVTKRGQKHLKEMVAELPLSRSVLVPCISRNDVQEFAPGDSADPCYGELFRKAISSGLEVIPCAFQFHIDKITWQGIKSFSLNE